MRHLAIATLILFSSNCFAVTVRGGPSCSSWLNTRHTFSEGTSPNEFWLLGYLSGLSVANDTDVLSNTPNNSLVNWIDDYCRANSLRNLEQAGADLFFELKRQKGFK